MKKSSIKTVLHGIGIALFVTSFPFYLLFLFICWYENKYFHAEDVIAMSKTEVYIIANLIIGAILINFNKPDNRDKS